MSAKNERGQSPSRGKREAAKRLEEKLRDQRGRANKERTQAKIRADRG